MLKHLFSAFACAILALRASAAPSPAATQAWVAKYVAERNGVVKWGVEVDGTNLEVEVRFTSEVRRALRVESSGDPRIPVGECFAYTAPGVYQNTTNEFCDAVCVERVAVGWCFPDGYSLAVATNGSSVTTNVVASKTNWLYRTAATFSAGSSRYRGFRSGGAFRCVDVADTNNAAEVVLVPHRQTAAERSATLAPRPSVSWLSLLVPSACAGWTPGHWEYTGNVKDDAENGCWLYEVRRHYYYYPQADAVESATLSVNGMPLELDVSGVVEQPPADSDYCDFSAPGGDLAADIANALVDGLVDQRGMDRDRAAAWCQRLLSAQSSAFEDLLRKFAALQSDLGNGAPAECPEYDDIVVPKSKEEETTDEAPDVPQPPALSQCSHPRCAPGSGCGNWTCADCGAKLPGPATHAWEDRNGHCARCGNSFGGIDCPASSGDRAMHYFGVAYGGTADGCRCKNGRIWSPHADPVKDEKWTSDEDRHWHVKRCKTCGWQGTVDEDAHAASPDAGWQDNENGTCSPHSVCSVCGYDMGAAGEPQPHSGSPTGSAVMVDDGYHALEYECSRCKTKFLGSPSAHTYALAAPPDSCENAGDVHAWDAPCDLAAFGCSKVARQTAPHGDWTDAGRWGSTATNHWRVEKCGRCDKERQGEASSHSWQWRLSTSKAQNDVMVCGDCGYSEIRPHVWHYADMVHWCANGSGHLMEAHSGGDPCSVCGYSASNVSQRSYCAGGCGCYSWWTEDSGGNVVAGPFESCAAGFANGSCQCGPCRDGHCNLCLCCHVYSFGLNKILSICDPDLDDGTALPVIRAYMQGITGVDMDDPVLNVGEGALEGAFAGFANLRTFKANYVTNIADMGCAGCFSNCPALSSVQFARLEHAGALAFNGAFVGCSALDAIDYPALKRADFRSFYRAFDSADMVATFPALQTVGDNAFQECGLTNLVLPSVTKVYSAAFYDVRGRISLPALRGNNVVSEFQGCFAALELPNLETVGRGMFLMYGGTALNLPAVTNMNSAVQAFDISSVSDLSLPSMTVDEVSAAQALCEEYPWFSLMRGCIIHCSDGDITVP